MRIRAKIFSYLLLFCVFLIALLWLFQVVLLDTVYKQIKIREVNASMAEITSNITNADLNQIADGIYRARGVNIAILTPGSTVFSVGSFRFQRDWELARELTRLYLLTKENSGEYFEYPFTAEGPLNDPRRFQNIYHCKIVTRLNGDEALIVLSSLITPVDAVVDTLKLELYVITAIMILFAMVLAFLISRRVSHPIISINQSAKRLAQGKYDAVFDEKGYREIKELAETLNIAARELSVVDELRRDLLANVSHDLRTPLALIAGYAEAMRDLPGENTPENVQIILDETNRLNRLVNEVLDLSKLQSGVMEIRPAAYNLTQSLRSIVERMSEFTKANGYRILLEADGDITVTADESAVSQAIFNLLTNAINFTGEDKTVVVRQLNGADTVTVEVEDTGKGLTQEELPYIWDRYYRTGKKHKRAVIGSGIGLSIVKSVMDLHGGAYGVKPAPDHGAVFWIQIKKG